MEEIFFPEKERGVKEAFHVTANLCHHYYSIVEVISHSSSPCINNALLIIFFYLSNSDLYPFSEMITLIYFLFRSFDEECELF